MLPTIRIGVIGTGFGARVHIPGFRAIPGVEVACIAGRDHNRTEEIARDLRVPKAYRSWEALIGDEALTAVSIATPPAHHHSIVLAAVQRGLHVLCEKPFGVDAKQALEMLAAANQAGIVHMVDFLFRMAPEHRSLKELLDSRAIGDIRHVNIEWTLRGRAAAAQPMRTWHLDRRAGGGTLFAFGSHVVDYLEWLLGPIRSVSAHLSARRPFKDERSDFEPAEDTVDIILLLSGGIPATVSISTVAAGGRGHWLSIYGEQGMLAVGNSNLNDVVMGTRLYKAGPEGNASQEIPVQELPDAGLADGRVSLFRRIAKIFTDAIRTDTPAVPSFRDGWRGQVVMDAIRRSHESRVWVDVSE